MILSDIEKKYIPKIHTINKNICNVDSSMSDKEIDQIDEKIIRMLQEDARTSFKEIARQCGVSTDTITNHFNLMKKNGVIRGTTIILDPKKSDKKIIVIMGIQITHPYSDQVLSTVNKVPGVCVATKAMGYFDIEAIAILKDIEQIGTTKNMIEDFQQVKNVNVDILVDKPLLCPKNFEFE